MKVINVFDGANVIPVKFYGLSDANTKEAAAYVEYVQARVNCPVKEIEVRLCADGNVDVSYFAQGVKFERIRRITGAA